MKKILILAAVVLSAALTGCVVEPWGNGGGYHHRHGY